MSNEGCLSGHYWNGSSRCSLCDARLRCDCGCYVREDNIDEHMKTCRVIASLASRDHQQEENDGAN